MCPRVPVARMVRRMDLLRHLRQFMVVAHELHFGRAAELLGIAQPPLSQAIQRLERELEVELFDRSRRQIRLTPAGQLLLGEAEALLAGEDRLRNVLRQVRDGLLGTLRAGVPPETPAVTLRELLDRLCGQAPELTVELHELTSAEQVRMLAEGRLDIGLVHHPVRPKPTGAGGADGLGELRFRTMVDVPLGVVLPRVAPLARAGEIALAELAGYDLILPPRVAAPDWYDHILAVCQRNGFVPDRVRSARSPEFLFGLLLAERCVAFEPVRMAHREPRVTWRPMSGQPLIRRTSAVWSRRSAHPATPIFAELASSVLAGPEPTPLAPVAAGTPRPWLVVYNDAPVPLTTHSAD